MMLTNIQSPNQVSVKRERKRKKGHKIKEKYA